MAAFRRAAEASQLRQRRLTGGVLRNAAEGSARSNNHPELRSWSEDRLLSRRAHHETNSTAGDVRPRHATGTACARRLHAAQQVRRGDHRSAVEKYIVDTAARSRLAARPVDRRWRPASGSRVVVGAGPAGLGLRAIVSRARRRLVYRRHRRSSSEQNRRPAAVRRIASFQLDRVRHRHPPRGPGRRGRGVPAGRRGRTAVSDRDLAAGLLPFVRSVPSASAQASLTPIGGLPGQDLPGVVPAAAVPWPDTAASRLAATRPMGVSGSPAGKPRSSRCPTCAVQRVVVLGSGDTGMDCVRSAARRSAGAVTCAYRASARRACAPMLRPAKAANARAKAVRFLFVRQPLERSSADAAGQVPGTNSVSKPALGAAAERERLPSRGGNRSPAANRSRGQTWW